MMKKHHKLKNLYFFMAERREFSYTAVEQQFPQNDSRLSGKIMQIVNEAIFETAWCGDCCFLK